MYGYSSASFSNLKRTGFQKHRKNAGLFIHWGVVALSAQTIAISLLFAKMQIFTQKMEGSTLGESQASHNKTMKFFVYYGNFEFFDMFFPQVTYWVFVFGQ